VESLSEFEHYSEMALTKDGLVKFKRGKHEKDDRPHIARKENYVLGWDNKEKINVLKKELVSLQNQQTINKKAIIDSNNYSKKLSTFKDYCNNLFSKFEKFDDIDWQSYAREIQEKSEQKSALEKANDRARLLQEQLQVVQNHLKQLEGTIQDKNREIFQSEEYQKSVERKINENKAVIETIGVIDITEFESQNPDLLSMQYSEIENKQRVFQETNAGKIAALITQKQHAEREVSIKINAFKQPAEEITSKFKDWRSDVNQLPDSINLEFISEYQKFLDKLTKDNLPKFEKKFNDYLQETITNKVGDFRMFFENWADTIKDNIRHLNESLRGIDFSDSPITYIQIVAPNKISDEVKEFRSLLQNAIPNFREVDKSIDGRKNHFFNHIEPLITKLSKDEWRKRVMDVRTWFTYRAEEFYRENNHKFKTYENMGSLSGGEKAQLTYTILGSAIAYQFGLTKDGLQSDSFRFIAIDEAFKAQDEKKAKYLITLCKQLHLQLLVVTPSDNIHIVENDISFVHFVERKDERHSWLWDMPIEQFKKEKEKFLANDKSI
jgi:uncharacterized protein YPO0396